MRIGGLQKLTLLDYPGLTACTIFLSGCNLRCPYCHNGLLVVPGKLSRAVSETELFAFLKKRQGLLDGVCVTGGEPLLSDEILPFLFRIKQLGYQVKLDTNGTNPARLKEVIREGLADYVAMDIKNSKERYPITVGREDFSIKPVEQSVDILREGKVEYEFRTTVVKGLHDRESIGAIGDWISGAQRYFLQNFRESEDLIAELSGIRIPMGSFKREELEEFIHILQSKQIPAVIRGE
ncbi:MAG: anaerobic ribonucleoside-triphosphate reductase activating protein [Lachnospiraceae bacterium]|nr:anaerobic ribonucleoside-triphosphate reductase activating protein [Lachnospiraceae bacterium]